MKLSIKKLFEIIRNVSLPVKFFLNCKINVTRRFTMINYPISNTNALLHYHKLSQYFTGNEEVCATVPRFKVGKSWILCIMIFNNGIKEVWQHSCWNDIWKLQVAVRTLVSEYISVRQIVIKIWIQFRQQLTTLTFIACDHGNLHWILNHVNCLNIL